MKLPKLGGEGPAAADSAAPKTLWTGVLSATPVVLTVLATLLAGLSNSEMTLAQYHRALAAQNQSKAGDQWSFFQAKRIRGTSLETTLDLLGTFTDVDRSQALVPQQAGQRLLDYLQRADREAHRLLAALKPAEAQLGSAGTTLRQATAGLAQATAGAIQETERALATFQHERTAGGVHGAAGYLRGDQLPEARTHGLADPAIQEVLRAIQERRPEAEIAPLVARISEDALQQALETAQANIQAVEGADKPVSETLARIGRLAQVQREAARVLERQVQAVDRAAAEVPAGGKAPADLHQAVATLDRLRAAARSEADAFRNAFQAAQYDYNARRYRREADWNEQAAKLYEVRVSKSSATSERHRTRSKRFFYGMLVAQAGVTIASFSLALKHQSVLWTLAALAGVGAVVFGAYVYLYM